LTRLRASAAKISGWIIVNRLFATRR